MGYRDWKHLYAACPGHVAAQYGGHHSTPRIRPHENSLDWRLTFTLIGGTRSEVVRWLESLTPDFSRDAGTEWPRGTHGHVCAVRTVVVADEWLADPSTESRARIAEQPKLDRPSELVQAYHRMRGWAEPGASTSHEDSRALEPTRRLSAGS